MTNIDRRKSFGKWLKERREAVRLTQMDLAQQLRYENPQIISNIERGFSALPARRVFDFAQALKCSGVELELRRTLSAAKDESCVAALHAMLGYLPLIETLCQPHLTWSQALETINNLRRDLRLTDVLEEDDPSTVVITQKVHLE